MGRLVNFVTVASQIPVLTACAALFFLMVMTFADVILRSTINAPIEAAPELTRMSIAVVVFAAMPVLSARGNHISVDLLDGIFARFRLIRIRDAAMAFVCGAILWLPARRVIDLAERSRSYGDTTEFLNWPVFYMSWFIAIMTFATVAALILRGVLLLFAPHYLKAQG